MTVIVTEELARELRDAHGEEMALVYRNGAVSLEHVPGLLAIRGEVTSDGEGYIVATAHGLPDLLNDADCWEHDADGNIGRLNNEGVDTLVTHLNSFDIERDAGIAIELWQERSRS